MLSELPESPPDSPDDGDHQHDGNKDEHRVGIFSFTLGIQLLIFDSKVDDVGLDNNQHPAQQNHHYCVRVN